MLGLVRWLQLGGLAVAAGCLCFPAAVAAQEPADVVSEFEYLFPQADSEGGLFAIGGAGGELSPYWIGVGCEPVPAVLRAQLKLPEGEGLVVVDVAEGSPAAAAGLQVNDVLLAAGDKPLKSVADLVSVVSEAKETDITFKLLRGGEGTTLVVRPAKRPEPAAVGVVPPGQRAGRAAARAFQWLAPGVVVGEGLFVPKDMSVTITLEHGKPARFAIKKGDKSWEVEQDKLNDLPPDVRGPVQGLLLTMPRLAAGIKAPPMKIEVFEEPFRPDAPPTPPRVFRWLQTQPGDPQIERRLDELKRQIDELRRAIEELSKKQTT